MCNCLLCIIVSNLNLILLTFRHYITVLLGSLFFTIIIKQLVQYSVFNIIIIIGFESIILLLVDFLCADFVMLVLPLSGIADPNGVASLPFDPPGTNQPLGRNLATELNRPEYRGKDMSNKMVGQYGSFILGAILNSTLPEGIEYSNKLIGNFDPNSNSKIPWWCVNNSIKLRNILNNA